MSDQEQQIDLPGLSDADLFKSATETTPPAPASDTGGQNAPEQPAAAAPPPPPQDGNQPRDEHGRFASKETPGAPQAGAPPQAPPPPPADGQQRPPASEGADAHVPSWRLREEREAREAAARRADEAERRFIQLQQELQAQRRHQEQQQQPIDPILDPQGFIALMREERERERMEDRLQFSMERAHEKHGTTFEEAYNAFVENAPRNQLWAQSMLRRPNPGQEIVSWYNKERAFQEYGSDPKAYAAKLRADLLKDPTFLAEASAAARAQATGQAPGVRPNNVTQMPVSLSRVAGGGPSPSLDLNMTDNDLYSHATARR
jgi:hypothetical protein